jgi:hypothetical protein
MAVQRFIVFFGVLLLLLLILDIYFLRGWTKYAKSRYWNKLSYQIPWGISALIFITYGYILFIKLWDYSTSGLERVILSAAAVWYLPKMLIVPIMMIKDLIKLIKKLIDKIRKAKIIEPSQADISRRKLLQTSGWILSGIPYVLVSKGLVSTTHDYTIYKADIHLPNLGNEFDDFVIVQLSDLHAGSLSSPEHFLRVAEITNRFNANLVVITGDFVNFSPHEMPSLIPGLEMLSRNNRVLGCLGNHDHYMEDRDHTELLKILRESGLDMLINENRTISKGSGKLHFAGVDNANFRTNYADFPKAMAGLNDDSPKILLCHDPTNWDRTVRGQLGVDLMLAGHTHGGQVGIDIFGQFISPVRIVYKQWAGLYKEGQEHLYINRGIGVVGPPLRVDMPPEITKITLKRISS